MDNRKEKAQAKWLEEGYSQFAEYGPEKLSINKISKAVEASRASFYHFFGDIDLFVDELLAKHWQICLQFNAYGRKHCHALFPDLYELLGQYTEPLQFNLQLFHHRHYPRFNYLFVKAYADGAHAFALKLFADHLGLNPNHPAVYDLWLTMGEAWYSRLDPKDLSAETMQQHSRDIIQTVSGFMKSRLYASLQQEA